MSFEEYLDRELSEPLPSIYSNEPLTSVRSNSARSIVERMRIGVLTSLKWEFKLYCHDYYNCFTDWDGINTPIAWFVFVLTSPVVFTCLPPITAIVRYNRAINLYRSEYIKATEEDDI